MKQMMKKIVTVVFLFNVFIFADDYHSMGEPTWVGDMRAFLGWGHVWTDHVGQSDFSYAEIDYMPLHFYVHQSALFSFGAHFATDWGFGDSDTYDWNALSWETGLALMWQKSNLQLIGRFSYRHLTQWGNSRVGPYELDDQLNRQFEAQVLLERYLEGNWLNMWQMIATFQVDLDKKKDSYWAGNKIPSQNDPANDQSCYGAELVVHIWNDRVTLVVPLVRLGYFHSEWSESDSVILGAGFRAFDYLYVNAGRVVFDSGDEADLENQWYLTIGLDVMALCRRRR